VKTISCIIFFFLSKRFALLSTYSGLGKNWQKGCHLCNLNSGTTTNFFLLCIAVLIVVVLIHVKLISCMLLGFNRVSVRTACSLTRPNCLGRHDAFMSSRKINLVMVSNNGGWVSDGDIRMPVSSVGTELHLTSFLQLSCLSSFTIIITGALS